MSETHKAIQQLFAVLDTAESQLGAVFGLTLSFEDGLALRTKAFERSDTFLHKCGYTSGVVNLASAGGMTDEALLAVIGVGTAAPAALGTTTVTPGEDPGPLSVEPEELEPVDEGPVSIEPVEIEPISLIPDATEELIQHSEPEPEPAIPEESDDATQLFAQGAIPVDWEDDDGESTVVMTRDAAAAMMAAADEEHFDLISPEEIEPEEIEPEEIEPEEIEPEEIEPETLTPIDNPPDADLPLDDATDEVPVMKASTPIASRAQVPTVRAASERPGAAAIQIGGPGGARVMPPEEDEEIAVEAAPDDEDYEYDSEGGFGLSLSEDDYEEYEEEEEEEPPAPPPAPIVIPPGPSQEVIQGFIDRARRESEDGSLEEAARSYSDALDGQPRQAEVRLARGRIFMDMGDYSRAISDFLIAEEITPDSAEPQVLMGELYSHRKDYAKAQGYLDIALRLNPRHPMAYYRRGLCFMKTREFSKAVDDLGRARALDDSLPGIDHFLGQAMKKAKPKRK